jgi:hypothetical protein
MSSRTPVTAELRADGQLAPIRLGPDNGPDDESDGGVVVRGPVIVEGTPQRIAGWLTGRVPDRAGLTVTGDLDDLPRWL